MLYLKALHIIFIVTWFSGIFYLGRLFIYQKEAYDLNSSESNILSSQFMLMTKRLLFGITWPSAILSTTFGLLMLIQYEHIPLWLGLKLGLVTLFWGYHISLHRLFKMHSKKKFKFSSFQLRIWNEVPTVFLVAITFLVTVKSELSLIYGLVGLFLLMVLLFFGIQLYKKIRKK